MRAMSNGRGRVVGGMEMQHPISKWMVGSVFCTERCARKVRSVSKSETMSLERYIDLRMRYRSGLAGKGVKESNRGLKDLRQGAGETRRE